MVELIRTGREFGYEKLTAAVELALDRGCADVAAIRHLMMSVEIGALAAYERPLPTMGASAFER